MNAHTDQLPLVLPARSADDILADKLAALVEQFNAATDPVERVETYAEILRLRVLLQKS